jgi:arginase
LRKAEDHQHGEAVDSVGMPRSIAIIGAPTSAGAYSPGQEEGPQAMRDAGLADGLRERGLEVVDLGDVPRFRWRPDRERPRAMNVPAVASAIVAVAEKVASAVDAGHLPLVLGGDCTIELGTVLGMRRHLPSLRLVYLDAHPDLNTPESVVDGALDWMGVAHLLDIPGALPELAGLGPRMPLLDDDELVLLGNSPLRTTEHERRVIAERGIANVPEQVVAAGPAAAAEEALRLVGDGQSYLVHLDTDVIDFAELPLAENTDRNVGLAFETVMRTLDGVLAGDGLAALTVSELDPHHGAPDGTTVRTFVGRLTASFAARAFA